MNVSQSIQSSFSKSLSAIKTRKDALYIIIFILALLAFEAFNFSTTDFALSDLLGDLRFGGIRWSTLLTIAFCGIDFAGISRLFAPQAGKTETQKLWYMFGAWILAATMNAILTWWGVVLAMQTHPIISAGVVNPNFVTKTVPIFIALMVWVIRIMLVGTFSKKNDKLIHPKKEAEKSVLSRREYRQAQSQAAKSVSSNRSVPVGFKGVASSKPTTGKGGYRPEPTYIPMQDEGAYHSVTASGTRRS